MNKSKALERGMRGMKGAEEDSALADLERATPGQQHAASKPKGRKMKSIRIEKSANGGFISHPEYEPSKSTKSSGLEVLQSEKPHTHADKQALLDHIDSSF